MAAPLLRIVFSSAGRQFVGSVAKGVLGAQAGVSAAKTIGSSGGNGPPMNITINSNINVVMKAVDAFGKNQLPFATSQTLNDAAFAVRKDTIESVWPKSVKVRNPAFIKAMMMPIRGDNRATKRRLRSIVQNYPSGSRNKDYLQRLAVGGVKTPIGRSIAIPAEDMPMRARGGVTARNRPRNALSRPKVFRQTIDGQEMILERRTKNRYPLKRLYLLEQQPVRIDDQFNFYSEAKRTARRAMAKSFNKRFAAAKRSARRK